MLLCCLRRRTEPNMDSVHVPVRVLRWPCSLVHVRNSRVRVPRPTLLTASMVACVPRCSIRSRTGDDACEALHSRPEPPRGKWLRACTSTGGLHRARGGSPCFDPHAPSRNRKLCKAMRKGGIYCRRKTVDEDSTKAGNQVSRCSSVGVEGGPASLPLPHVDHVAGRVLADVCRTAARVADEPPTGRTEWTGPSNITPKWRRATRTAPLVA